MDTTKRLARAVEAWVDEAETWLNARQLAAFEACLTAKQADIEVAVRLRDGVVELRGVNKRSAAMPCFTGR